MKLKFSFLIGLFAVSVAAGQSVLDNLLSPSRLPFLKQGTLVQISSNDTTGGNDDFIIIPAGGTARLAEIKGPGVITMFWTTIASSDKYFLRHIVLRMYWDGENDPSVEAPIGDFFGTGFQVQTIHYAVRRNVQRRILLLFSDAVQQVCAGRGNE